MARPRSFNTWTIKHGIAYAILKHGTVVVDSSDYIKVRDYRWFTKKSGNNYYVYAHLSGNKKIMIHRHIMGITNSLIIVDHINGNTLDNTTRNLRIATRIQNNMNSKKRKNSLTKYKGVTKRPSGRFGCYIHYNKKSYCLGTFDTQEEAALAYNKKAFEFYKEYAKLNNIKGEKHE